MSGKIEPEGRSSIYSTPFLDFIGYYQQVKRYLIIARRDMSELK